MIELTGPDVAIDMVGEEALDRGGVRRFVREGAHFYLLNVKSIHAGIIVYDRRDLDEAWKFLKSQNAQA